MKRSFFQAAVTSILLYGCTTWMLTKQLEKKLDGNYSRMLRAILNKSWRQHPTRHQVCGHLPPITKTIQVRRTRHARHYWRSRDKLIRDVLLWTPTHGHAILLLGNCDIEIGITQMEFRPQILTPQVLRVKINTETQYFF